MFEKDYVEVTAETGNGLKIKSLGSEEVDFVLCRGMIYAPKNISERVLKANRYAYAVESGFSISALKGADDGFILFTTPETRQMKFTTEYNDKNCQILEIAGVLIRATIKI